MRRRGGIFGVFCFFLLFSFLLVFLSQKGLLGGVTGILEDILVPIQRLMHSSLVGMKRLDATTKLADENRNLLGQLVKMRELERENQALRYQFETSSVDAKKLLPAAVIGTSSFVPGVSLVDELIIDKGISDGLKKGSVVVYKDNLVGKVVRVFPHASVVDLPIHKDISLAVRTSKTQALGILRGQGSDGMLLDNVVLSDHLEKGDLVETKGDMDTSGAGYPPHLVVGKILSVDKKNSALFQTGNVESILDLARLEMVFVLRE